MIIFGHQIAGVTQDDVNPSCSVDHDKGGGFLLEMLEITP